MSVKVGGHAGAVALSDMDVCKGKATEGSIRVPGQVWVIVICTNIHSYRRACNRLQEVIHCNARVSNCNH